MKANVTYFRAVDLDKVSFKNEEDRLAYMQVDGLVYLPSYPKIIDLPEQVGVESGIVEATYMSLEEFVSSPPPPLSKYAGKGINALLAKIQEDFYIQDYSAAYRLCYSLFSNHIAIAEIYIIDPMSIC